MEPVSSAVPLNPGTIPSLTFLEQRMQWLGKFGEQILEGGLGHTSFVSWGRGVKSSKWLVQSGGEGSPLGLWWFDVGAWLCREEESDRFIEQSLVELVRVRE